MNDDRDVKRWATARARLALAGFAATRLVDADGDDDVVVYRVARWKWCREFDRIEAVEAFLVKVTGQITEEHA